MKTKKISAALVVFAVTLGLIASALLAAPVSAQEQVNTGAFIATGGGNPPIIKAKWEQDYSSYLEDGDPLHLTPGSQFDPTCQYQVYEPVTYCAVVTDVEDGGDVQQVAADVWHPKGETECGKFKYEAPMQKITDPTVAMAKLKNAYYAGLITFGPIGTGGNYTIDDVIYELEKGTAKVWCGDGTLYYEQPAGDYKVSVKAYDFNSNPSNPLNNTFEYVPTTCFAVDNNAINYGSVSISKPKVIPGDTIFSPGDGKMTVRNLGNTWMNVSVYQDDMGFGQDITGKWNVQYDGRLGHLVGSLWYDPFTWTTLPGTLPLSTDDELDFSIHVWKGEGEHSGTMQLGSVIIPFGKCE